MTAIGVAAGYALALVQQRLKSIRWRADRSWKAWHLHDVRFLLGYIDHAQKADR